MNWKNVLYLLRVERKSGRLLRGAKTTNYRERGIIAYWPYWAAAIIGILGGYVANFIAAAYYAEPDVAPLAPLSETALGIFVSLPTLILISCVVLTMLQQIQLSGLRANTQVMYWMPITWQEHTLASILANLLGIPIATVIAFTAGILVFASFNGLVIATVLTSIALFGAAFMASSTTEILRVIQVRFTGAVYKSSGKAAVWVRFAGTIAFMLVFFAVYLALTQGTTAFIEGITTIQNQVWFIPFVWLGVTLFYLLSGAWLQGTVFIALSALFIAALFYLAITLNKRFGLYEPPAITVQISGTVYAPKTGILGKLGFSTPEAALITKDIRAFTRRRELMSIFVVPIVFVILPIMNSINFSNSGAPPETSLIFIAMIFLIPCSTMAMSMGTMLIGEEGQAVWRIYASPISPQNLVKSKLFFLTAISILILIATGIAGAIFYQPSPRMLTIAFLEGLFLVLALGPVSLAIGFKGADFSVSRRARMIRQEWSLISLPVCALFGLAVLAPLIPHVLGYVLSGIISIGTVTDTYLIIASIVSGVIAGAIAAIFYKINLNSAKELIRKAEV